MQRAACNEETMCVVASHDAVRDVLRIDHLLHTACYSKLVFVKYHHALEAGKEGKADGDDDDSDEPVDVSDQVSQPIGLSPVLCLSRTTSRMRVRVSTSLASALAPKQC